MDFHKTLEPKIPDSITKVDTHIRQKHFDSHYDYRANMPQFKDDAIDQNQKLLDLVKMTAEKKW